MQTHRGPRTWESQDDAVAWLRAEERLIEFETWIPPANRDAVRLGRSTTVSDYAERWIEQRKLKPSTRSLYKSYRRNHLIDTDLGDTPVGVVELSDIRDWFADLQAKPAGKGDGSTRNAGVYAWLRTVFESAVDDKLLAENPARIKRGGVKSRKRAIVVPTPAEVDEFASEMPERLQLLPYLAAWCAMRRGELLGLRRCDVAKDGSELVVAEAITFVDKTAIVGTPKNNRQRVVAVPPHLHQTILDHVKDHASPGRKGLLFPREPGSIEVLTDGQLRHYWEAARKKANAEHVRLHDLRHAGSMWAASTGATLSELQQRLGHESTAAAIRYMHAASGSDKAIAERLSALVKDVDDE
ncbi:tyrosine-type recombinase/integrase [Gordonia iterans]